MFNLFNNFKGLRIHITTVVSDCREELIEKSSNNVCMMSQKK